MKEKLTSRKFWMVILVNLIFVVAIFTNLGGTVGSIFGIIGIILSSISYIFIEGKLDVERIKVDYKEVKKILKI